MKLKDSVKIFIGITLLIVVSGIPFGVSAKTLISKQEACFYNIQVLIAFDFDYQVDDIAADKILTSWQKKMTAVWNGVNGSTIINSQCFASYEFKMIKVESGKECADYPDYHCIKIVDEVRNQRGNLADVFLAIPNSELNSSGEWSSRIRPAIAAHEVGHLMGLPDEYGYKAQSKKLYQNNNFKKQGPQSIMAQTWGLAAALSEHTVKILQSAGIEL